MFQNTFANYKKLVVVMAFGTAIISGCAQQSYQQQSDQQKQQFVQRPLLLIQSLPEGELKSDLLQCNGNPLAPSDLSIAHRGAPAILPEHSKASYQAAAAMGAGVIECDVVPTKDGGLVCRHEQCDLHYNSDILLRPELAQKCSQPFQSANGVKTVSVSCCTSDITLKEFKSLCGIKTSVNKTATRVEEYLNLNARQTESCDPLMSFADSIELMQSLNRKITPELKPIENSVYEYANGAAIPLTQASYSEKFINTLRQYKVDAKDVWLQSFEWDDIKHWQQYAPEYSEKLVWLDGRYFSDKTFNPNDPNSWQPQMTELRQQGLNIIAPPIWVLITAENGRWVPSAYAKAARAAGLDIITWTTEKYAESWYYRSAPNTPVSNASLFELLDILVKEVGVIGVFSDFAVTTSYYANCRS